MLGRSPDPSESPVTFAAFCGRWYEVTLLPQQHITEESERDESNHTQRQNEPSRSVHAKT